MAQKKKAPAASAPRHPLAQMRDAAPHQEFDILVPGDTFEFSPDEDRRRVFVFRPLSDQTLTRIVFEASSVAGLRDENPLVALASTLASTTTTSRRVCEEALTDWRGLTDQHGRVVPFRKDLLSGMASKLLDAVGDHIFEFSRSLATELKKAQATTADATTPVS